MLPNFLILGAPRSGTTSLYEVLKQHPQIFLSPIKEPMFFVLQQEPDHFPGPKSPQGSRTLDEYRSLFQAAGGQQAVGEASPCYLSSPKALQGIKKIIPDAKMIAILRNPVDRAYSHFLFHRLEGAEPCADFEHAVAAEEERERLGWFSFWRYRGMGLYGRQIENYFSHFDPKQFHILLFEDLIADPHGLFRGIFRFLGVDPDVRISLPLKYNPSGIPRSRMLHEFLIRPNIFKKPLKRILAPRTQYFLLTLFSGRNLAKPRMDMAVRRRMLEYFREDILLTQDLLDRDLSAWLDV
jgi:hypothetical protein